MTALVIEDIYGDDNNSQESPPRVSSPPKCDSIHLKTSNKTTIMHYFVLRPLQKARQNLFASLLTLAGVVFVVTLLQAQFFTTKNTRQQTEQSFHARFSRGDAHRIYASKIEAEIEITADTGVIDVPLAPSEVDKITEDFTNHDKPEKVEPENYEFNEKRMEKIFVDRQDQATRTCLKYYNYGPNISFIPYREVSYRFIYVDDVHKILYCSVPKVASTNWKRMFMLLGSNGNQTLANMAMDEVHEGNATWPFIKPLKSYSPVEVAARIQNYTKIMWVRNPLHRLVSAWRSKFLKNNTFYNEVYGSYIIKKYRPKATEAEIKAGFPVSLKEFFLYLRDEGLVRGDVHWGHYHTHCLSCIIPYDYFGKLEDMAYEATYILRKITGDNEFKFPLSSERKPGSAAPSANDRDYMAAIKELPLDLLQYVSLEYKIDYEMFGYAMPKFFD